MKILVPTDFSETAQNAFRHALIFADKTQAELHVLHVVYPIADTLDIPALAADVISSKAEAAREVMDNYVAYGLSQVSNQLKSPPKITHSVEVGGPVAIIQKWVEAHSPDLVIMGTQGTHSTIEKILGTVSSGVIARVDCPVLIIPEQADIQPLHTIAYATDIQASDPFEIWKASQLLAPLSAVFHIVHISKKEEEADEGILFKELRAYFESHPLGLQTQFHHLTSNKLENKLNEFMTNFEIDLLVMFRPERSFIDRLFRPSYTQKMARKTEIPMLVMKT